MGLVAQIKDALADVKDIPGINLLVCTGRVIPEFLRFPRTHERCPITGLSASTLRNVIRESRGKVVVRVHRQRGKLRGVTLIDHDSLVTYLRSLPMASITELEEACS